MKADAAHPASFRDPSGFVFRREGVVYRHVGPSAAADYDLLLASGLYRELVDAGLLVAHEEVALEGCPGAHRVLRPDPVELVSVSLRVGLLAAPGRGPADPRRGAAGARARPGPQGRQRLQRAVPRLPARLHRHALVRGPARGRAVGRLPSVLRALPGPPRAHVARRPAAGGAVAGAAGGAAARPRQPDAAARPGCASACSPTCTCTPAARPTTPTAPLPAAGWR